MDQLMREIAALLAGRGRDELLIARGVVLALLSRRRVAQHPPFFRWSRQGKFQSEYICLEPIVIGEG